MCPERRLAAPALVVLHRLDRSRRRIAIDALANELADEARVAARLRFPST